MDWQTVFLLIAGISMAYWMHCTMQREAATERQLDALTAIVRLHTQWINDNIKKPKEVNHG